MTSIEIIIREDDGPERRLQFPNVSEIRQYNEVPGEFVIGWTYRAVPHDDHAG